MKKARWTMTKGESGLCTTRIDVVLIATELVLSCCKASQLLSRDGSRTTADTQSYLGRPSYNSTLHNDARNLFFDLQSSALERLESDNGEEEFNTRNNLAEEIGWGLAVCHGALHPRDALVAMTGDCGNTSCFARTARGQMPTPTYNTTCQGILTRCGAVNPPNEEGATELSRQRLRNSMTNAPSPRGSLSLQRIFRASMALAEASGEARKPSSQVTTSSGRGEPANQSRRPPSPPRPSWTRQLSPPCPRRVRQLPPPSGASQLNGPVYPHSGNQSGSDPCPPPVYTARQSRSRSPPPRYE